MMGVSGLEAGWNRQSALSHTIQKGLSVGVEASVGTSGAGISLSASGQMQRTNMESHQATAADTVLNATNSVSLTSGGKATLKGAEVNASRIDVKAAALEITSPQDTSDYRSTVMQATAGVKIPLYGAATGSVSASYQNQKTTDHFVSTGQILSGLYAGDQGIGIDVSGNTSLTAGVISSTASREKNHFNTGSLEAHSLENSSAWKSQSVGFQADAGSGMLSGSITKILTSFGTGMAANSMSMLGGSRSHDERSESQSAISDNITVNAEHVTGSYSRDVDHANGALTNKFDAQKLQNQIRASQLGTQLVGEVMGRVSDKLYSHRVQGFDEHSATNNWGRAILEAGGSAAVAAVTGGNVAATATSVFAGTIASGATRDWADRAATALTGQPTDARSTQAKLHDSLMNLLSNGIASAAGAAGGLVAGPGNATANALNGASAASAIQQYNQAANVGTIDDTPAINPLSIPEAGVALVGAAVLIAAEELYNGLGNSHDPGAASVPSQTASSDNGQGSGSVNFQVVSPGNPWKEAYIPPSERPATTLVFPVPNPDRSKYQEAYIPPSERFEIPGFSISDSKEFPTSEIFDLPSLEFLNSGLGYGAVYMTASGGVGKQSSLPPWRASEKDFVGEQGSKNKEGLRIMPASEDSKAAAYKFLDDITKWLAQDGIEEVSNQKRPIAKAGGTRHEIIFSDGTIVNIRDGESAGNKTDNSTYTLEVKGHPDIDRFIKSGNLKMKFRQIKK